MALRKIVQNYRTYDRTVAQAKREAASSILSGFKDVLDAWDYVAGWSPTTFLFFTVEGFEVKAGDIIWAIEYWKKIGEPWPG